MDLPERLRSWSLIPVLVFLVSCATGTSMPPPETVDFVDLRRYQGKWFEIARLPAWFQRGCVDSTATYVLLESGKMEVHNECLTGSGGLKGARGTARVVDTKTFAKLEVVFDNWFSRLFSRIIKGKYWILYLDRDYQTVLVGTPDRKYLWIMARTPIVDDRTYQDLVDRARALGFETDDLIRARR